jgi:20S proteasome alpha/beta subunit
MKEPSVHVLVCSLMFNLSSRLLWFATSLLLFRGIALANAAGDQRPVLTGTVNIILANGNGIVVIADSKQTGKSPAGEVASISRPGQKLFRIDDRTVCTIAGFGSASLPNFSEFINSAAGVLDQYISELHSKGGVHSFHEKLASLAFLFRFYLFGIGNLQDLTPEQAGDYGFNLLLAGYDSDGTPKIGSLSLSSSFSSGRFEPVLKNVSERTIGRELVYEKAGIGGPVAKNILDYPRQFATEREIGRYAVSMAADSGSSLGTPEMEDLARALVRHAATVYPQFIGGRDQVAILRNGGIQSIEQPNFLFEPREQNTHHFSILTGLVIDLQNVPGAVFFREPAGSIGLFIVPPQLEMEKAFVR